MRSHDREMKCIFSRLCEGLTAQLVQIVIAVGSQPRLLKEQDASTVLFHSVSGCIYFQKMHTIGSVEVSEM